MALPLSLDLRRRAAAALVAISNVCGVAKCFSISPASAVRIGQCPGPEVIWPRARSVARDNWSCYLSPEVITTHLAAKADWTVRALAADLKTAGIDVTHDGVCVPTPPSPELQKTLLVREADWPAIARRRTQWRI